MKKLALLVALLLPSAAWAQHTLVTAVVKDANGSIYTNCNGSASFIGENLTPGAGPYLLGGSVFQTVVPLQCDSSGNLSLTLADNLLISPSPSQWNLGICAPAGLSAGGVPPPICFSALLTITGTTQNITASLQAVAAILPPSGGGGSGGRGVVITTELGLVLVPGKTKGTIAVVTDGQSSGDCTSIGGGTYIVTCQYSGVTWSQITASGTGGTSWAAITGGTNTNALVIGSGGSLTAAGTGLIAATSGPFPTRALGNLTSPTAANQDLLPDITATRSLGSSSLYWLKGWFGSLDIATTGMLTWGSPAGAGMSSDSIASNMIAIGNNYAGDYGGGIRASQYCMGLTCITSWPSGGGSSWPGGTSSGIANYSYPNSWGNVYNASNTIPANFLSPNITSNTSGTAANLSGTQQANYLYGAPNGTNGAALFRPVALADLSTGGFVTGSNLYVPTSPSLAGPANVLLVQDGSAGLVPATGNVSSGGTGSTQFTFKDNTTPSQAGASTYTYVYSKNGALCAEGANAGGASETCTGTGGGGSLSGMTAGQIPIAATATTVTSSVAAPAGAIVGTTDSQALTNKTLDGVTSTTMGYVDATSSIQTQLNAKLPNPASNGIVLCTGTACSTQTTISSATGTTGTAGGIIGTEGTAPTGVTGDALYASTANTCWQWLHNSTDKGCLATLASPTFTGTPTIPGATVTGAFTGAGNYIPVSLLNSGTSASSSTFWRGDGTWAAPTGTGTVTGCSFTGGLISCSGSTTTASTVAGTSGGIPYFSGATTWASSGALTQYAPVLGGGAGATPTSGHATDNGTIWAFTEGMTVSPSSTSQISVVANNPSSTSVDLFEAQINGVKQAWIGSTNAGEGFFGPTAPNPTIGTSGGAMFTCGTVPTGIASNDALYCDAANQPHALSGTTDLGIVSTQSQTAQIVTADWTCGTGGTNTSCVAAQTIGTLTFTLPLEAKNWSFDCNLIVGQATGATANNWDIQTATNGATNTSASWTMATAATAFASGALTGSGSSTSSVDIGVTWTLGATGTKMPVHISGTIEGASASGTVFNLQLKAPTVGDLVTIYRGSECRIF
jgi:hypothetical protein